MKIYIDLLLLENFIVVFFLLTITTMILRVRIDRKKFIIPSIIGAIYTLVLLIKELKVFTYIPFQILVALCMIYLILKDKNIRTVLKGTVIYILSACTLAGIVFFFAIIQNGYKIDKSFSIKSLSIKYIFLGGIILFLFIERSISYFRDRVALTSFIYDVEISIDDKKIYVKGLLDTGNELREPVTNLPCIIVEEGCIEEYIKDKKERFFIPFSVINSDGKLEGVIGDKVRVKLASKDEWEEVKAIICTCKDKFNNDNEYVALLSRGIL